MLKKLTLLFIAFFVLSTCDDDPYYYVPDFSQVPAAFPKDASKKTVQTNGLIIYEVETGTGPFTVNNRDVVNGYYTGRLTNGTIFDSSYRDGFQSYTTMSLGGTNSANGGFIFIEGFRLGFVGMKEGGKRVVVIPPDLGYGGTSNRYANDTLIFDIEVHSIVSGKVTSN